MIRVMIADDHPILRDGIKRILTEDSDIKVVAEASYAEEIFNSPSLTSIDILLLDISMPGKNGFDVMSFLKQNKSAVKILILSALSEDLFAVKSLEAGASGYLHKECAPEELVAAIRKVYAGGIYISPKIADKLALKAYNGLPESLHNALSDREFQIFLKIGMGMRTGQIANELNLSVNTVSTYRKRIIEKTGIKNNSEIILYCIRQGLLVQ